jgi:hypothetical protein
LRFCAGAAATANIQKSAIKHAARKPVRMKPPV